VDDDDDAFYEERHRLLIITSRAHALEPIEPSERVGGQTKISAKKEER